VDGKLDDTDKKFLRGEIRQIVVSYVALFLVSAVVFTAGTIFILQSDLSSDAQSLLLGLLSVIGLITFGAFLWNSIKNPLADLRCGTKRVVVGRLLDKQDSINYGWTGNIGADSASQPKLVEYRLTVDEMHFVVDLDDFARYAVGDKVKVHLSQVTSKLLRLE
jgi:hypothetical protein